MNEFLRTMDELAFATDWTGILAVVAYVLQALALYTIAERRGIKKPWLAWVPVVNVWILGSVSDQYQYVTKQETKNKRKVLLGINLALLAVALFFVVALIIMLVQVALLTGVSVMDGMFKGNPFEEELLISQLVSNVGLIFGILALAVLAIGLTITFAVFKWMAIYDVYRSCEPSNAVVYLVVGIVGGFVIEGVHTIFLMICRNKDLGMPPRKPETVPAAEPVVEEPVAEEPVAEAPITEE